MGLGIDTFYKKKSFDKKITKNISFLVIGTLLSQSVQVLFTPYLTRLYTPQTFGVFSIYFSVVSLISVFITGRYEYTILFYKKSNKAYNAFYLTIFIVLFLSSFSLVIYLIFISYSGFESFLRSNDSYLIIEPYIVAIIVNALIIGIYQGITFLLNYENDYKNLSKSRVILSITTLFIQFIFSEFSIWGLIIGNIMGYLLSEFILYLIIKSKYQFQPINKRELVFIAKENKELPLINGTHSIINILKDNVINFFLYSTYSNIVLGNYYLMFRIIKLPVSLVGNSISQVLIKEITNNRNDFLKILKDLFVFLILIGLLPTTILFFYGEELFIYIFGENWSVAGKMAESTSLYMFSHFFASPLTGIPIILKKQKVSLIWGVIESLLFISIFIISHALDIDLQKTLYILSCTFFIFFLIYVKWIFKICKKNNSDNE